MQEKKIKLCQIMTFGGKEQWIRLGLRYYPDTWRVVLITNRLSESPQSNISLKDEETREIEDYSELALDLIKSFKQEESTLPEVKNRRYDLIHPPNNRDLSELIRYFRELIDYLYIQGYRININITSGLQLQKIALIQAAMDKKSIVNEVYLIEKDTGRKQSIWLYRDLTDSEKRVVNILFDNPGITLGELQKRFFKVEGKGNLTYVSKLIKRLVNDDLVFESKVGRNRILNLTENGRSLGPGKGLKKLIEGELNKKNK